MKIKGWIFITALIIWLSQQVFAQDMSFSLRDAQNYAVENNYNIRNVSLDVQIAEKKVKETMALGLPQINGTIDYSYYLQLPTTLLPAEFAMMIPGMDTTQPVEVVFGTTHNANLGLSLNQLIFDGRYLIGLQYSKLYKQLTEQTLIKSELDVKAMVTETYYSNLVGQESLKVLDSTKSVLDQTRYETNEMFKEGFVEETDVDQLTLTIKDIENSINTISVQNELGLDMLKFQMGIPLDQEITLSETLDDILNSIAIEIVLDQPFVMEENIDYQILKGQEEMKLLNLKNEKAAYWPAINGYFITTQNAQREAFSFMQGGQPWFASTSTGFRVDVPILSGGMRRARVNQAKIELDQMKNNREQLEQSLQLSVLQARSAFYTAVQNYFREEESVELSLKIYRKALIKYSEGVTTSAELTQQHNQFFNAETRYFQTVLVLLNAKNQLDKTLGNY